jgi:hypothetical protein
MKVRNTKHVKRDTKLDKQITFCANHLTYYVVRPNVTP